MLSYHKNGELQVTVLTKNERKNMMKPYGGLITVAGLKRREIREWWKNNGSPFDVCTLYNDGLHIYTLGRNESPQLIPGSFIQSPMFLTCFPYTEIVRKIGKFRIIHRGHRFSPSMSSAQIAIELGEAILPIDIVPMSIAYAIRIKGGVASVSMRAGLPVEVLKSN